MMGSVTWAAGDQSNDIGAVLRHIARTSSEPSKALNQAGLIPRIPELAALDSVPQDARWHPEGDVLTHSLLAVDAAAQLWDAQHGGIDRREIVVLSALFHDVGKPDTTRTDGASVSSLGHAEAGELIVVEMGARFAWPAGVVSPIAGLVRTHMAPVSIQGDPTRRAVNRLRARLADAGTSLEEWAVVVAADGAARGAASIPSRAEPWLRIAENTS